MMFAALVLFMAAFIMVLAHPSPANRREWLGNALVALVIAWVVVSVIMGGVGPSIDPNAGQHM